MATATSTIVSSPPLMLFKSQIFRNHLIPWKKNSIITTIAPKNAQLLLLRPRARLVPFPISLIPHHLHLPPLNSQIHHRNFLSPPHPPPLLRLSPPSLSPSMSSLASPPDSIPTKTVRVVIKGRVQGVFYRNWTVDNARELGLKGWVRNRRDGSVEALFSGSHEKVGEMEQRCRRGPPSAMVTGFDVVPCSDDPGTGFERRPTV